MPGWLPVLALVVIGAGACASPSSSSIAHAMGRLDALPPPPQPSTIDEVVGGRKYTGYVSVTYGEGGRIDLASQPGAFASGCAKKLQAWSGRGKAPCATVTLELDGEPKNFWVAGYWSAAAGTDKSIAVSRTLIASGAGFLPASSVSASLLASRLHQVVLDFMLRMYGGLLEIVGAATPEACQALRPPAANRRLGDGRCQPARLDID